MRFTKCIAGCGILALLLAFSFADAQEVKKKIKPTERWTGKIADDKAKAYIPDKSVITNGDAFKRLWEVWRPKDKLPEIAWNKHIVIVQIAGGPNIPSSSYVLDTDGNLKSSTLSTLIGGPGFGYSIEVIHKEGIKSYQGKKIE